MNGIGLILLMFFAGVIAGVPIYVLYAHVNEQINQLIEDFNAEQPPPWESDELWAAFRREINFDMIFDDAAEIQRRWDTAQTPAPGSAQDSGAVEGCPPGTTPLAPGGQQPTTERTPT